MKKLIFALLLVAPVAASAAPLVPYLPVPKDAAVILDTGSTNTLGYRIVVQRSGAAEYISGSRRAKVEVAPSLAAQFFKDAQAAMPLTAQGASDCMKSSSFGSSLFVWWKGSRSGDLTCGASAVANDALKIAQAIGMSTSVRTPLVRPIPMLTNEPRRPLPPQPMPSPSP